MKEGVTFKSYKGRINVYKCVQGMLEEAGALVRIMTTENGIVRMWEYRRDTYKWLLGKMVTVKIALPITRKNMQYVKYFTEIGAEIKHLPKTARNRFVNVDGKQVIAHFTSQDDFTLDAEDDCGVWTTSVEFVELTARFFDNLWDRLATDKVRCRTLTYGLWIRIAVTILFFVFVSGTIWSITNLDLPSPWLALSSSVAATLFFLLGSRVLGITIASKG